LGCVLADRAILDRAAVGGAAGLGPLTLLLLQHTLGGEVLPAPAGAFGDFVYAQGQYHQDVSAPRSLKAHSQAGAAGRQPAINA